MKTFADLKIHDLVYVVSPQNKVIREVDKLGHTIYSGEVVKATKITYLQRASLSGANLLFINKNLNSYNSDTYDFIIPADHVNETSWVDNKNNIVFADKRLAKELVKQTVLKALIFEEERISIVKSSVEENIKSIRNRYYHVLNNVDHEIQMNS